jgi:hypothetical protein
MIELAIIDSDQKINASFVKANGLILKKYKDQFEPLIDFKQKNQLLEALWLQEYRARLLRDDNNWWTKIVFEREKDLTLFQLRWS